MQGLNSSISEWLVFLGNCHYSRWLIKKGLIQLNSFFRNIPHQARSSNRTTFIDFGLSILKRSYQLLLFQQLLVVSKFWLLKTQTHQSILPSRKGYTVCCREKNSFQSSSRWPEWVSFGEGHHKRRVICIIRFRSASKQKSWFLEPLGLSPARGYRCQVNYPISWLTSSAVRS